MTTISLLPRRRPPGPSRDSGVPKATLLRHLYHKNVHANAAKKHFGRCTELPDSVESELAKHVVKLGEQNVGLTTRSLRHLAYEIAEGHNLKHRCHGLSVYAVCVCNKVRLPGTGQSAHVIGGSRFTRPASNSRRTLLN